MSSKYEKNFKDYGYQMNYEKAGKNFSFKNQVLQFKIELQDISPIIWRRILVPSNYNFWDLHVAIQDSMGWNDSHLHHFEIRGKGKKKVAHIGIPDFDRTGDLEEVSPGWEILVLSYFNELGIKAKYEYDYGDGWKHTVQLEGYLYKDKDTKLPICIGGERACPPEDCGGVSGYYNVLKSISDIADEDYEDMKKWVGQGWHPECFYKDLVKFDNPYKRWRDSFLEK
jgi:Plasmid pRiA4b ORF-3-like protein